MSLPLSLVFNRLQRGQVGQTRMAVGQLACFEAWLLALAHMPTSEGV